MKVSVVTLTKNRNAKLLNQLRGLLSSKENDFEYVLVVMGGDDPKSDPEIQEHLNSLSAKVIYLNESGLPLAKARNTGFNNTYGELVIFLDVDCIPSPDLIQAYVKLSEKYPQMILMGQVHYLPENFEGTLSKDSGTPHPGRDFKQCEVIENYNLFWSLSFAIRKNVYQMIGGFDESFTGYGAEDTDFSFIARKIDIKLLSCPEALSFHQYHPSYDPPLNHFKDVLSNASTFKHKWGFFPMEGWLKKFETMKFIRFYNNEFIIQSYPDKQDIESVLKA